MVICKFKKCKPNAKEITWVCTYIVYQNIFLIGNKLKIGNKRNRKTNFFFWNFKDEKIWKNRTKKPPKISFRKKQKKGNIAIKRGEKN